MPRDVDYVEKLINDALKLKMVISPQRVVVFNQAPLLLLEWALMATDSALANGCNWSTGGSVIRSSDAVERSLSCN